jgi:hypothetical protein
MLGAVRHLGARRLMVAGILAVVAGTGVGVIGVDPDAPGTASGAGSSPCGLASASTIAGVDAAAARRIYAGELHGTETRADIGHITSSRALLSALAGSNEGAVRSAVHALVYAPNWHIVRLRVIKAGRVIADVGGPYIIAPVSGSLKWNGRTVGHYVMSVQDDVGYVKLVTRFIGVPIDLYRSGSPLMGTLEPAPASASDGGPVSIGGRQYQAQVLNMQAFPSGSLRVALLVPRPSGSVTQQSCMAVRVAAWGEIAKHVAGRFKPLPPHYQDLVDVLRSTTGFPAYVTSGSRRVAGGAGPSRIPAYGTVSFGDRSWSVFSWEPSRRVRVYLLTPPR